MFIFGGPTGVDPSSRHEGFGIGAVLAGGIIAAIPAHGFVIGERGLMFTGTIPPSRLVPTHVTAWFKTFLGACIWAAAMAAGMLVYQHFLRRWEEKGFPTLPSAAMMPAVGHMMRGPSGGIPLASPGSGSATNPNRQREPSRQTSFLDEFEG